MGTPGMFTLPLELLIKIMGLTGIRERGNLMRTCTALHDHPGLRKYMSGLRKNLRRMKQRKEQRAVLTAQFGHYPHKPERVKFYKKKRERREKEDAELALRLQNALWMGPMP